MAEQEQVAGHGDDSRLPVPAGRRWPEVRRTGIAPVDTAADALVRAAGAPLLAPLAATAVVGATAAAVTEVVARLMRSWLGGGPGTTWSGPGVHLSYTHLEVHWPDR
jgi:hypothetical protein